MLCIECGETLKDNVKFCSKCGGQQPEKETPVEKLKTKCTSCDVELENKWIVCPYCGNKINDISSPPVPSLLFPDTLENSIMAMKA
jgi:rRNA maturation endonuclease Nob1